MGKMNEKLYGKDLEIDNGGERLEMCQLLFADDIALISVSTIIKISKSDPPENQNWTEEA